MTYVLCSLLLQQPYEGTNKMAYHIYNIINLHIEKKYFKMFFCEFIGF